MGRERFRDAIALHKAGRLDEAARLYSRVLSFEPGHAGALHLLGVIRLSQERLDEAVSLATRATGADPKHAAAWCNLGSALFGLRRIEAARDAFERAIALDPRHALSLLNLSGLLLATGAPREAFGFARRAAEAAPDLAAAYCNAGLALRATGAPDRAETMFLEALRRDPRHAETLHDYGNLLRALGDRDDEALALLAAARDADPTRIETLVALSRLATDRGEPDPDGPLREAAARSPDDPLVRLALGMSALVAFHDMPDGPTLMRENHLARIAELDAWVRDGGEERLARFADAVGFVQPFHLPYAGGTDLAAQIRHGTLCADAMRARYPAMPLPPPPGPGEPIRIGFVSGYMRDHSNWHVPLRGWLEGLDRAAFQVFGYHTGEVVDDVTGRARDACTRFVQGPLDTARWRDEIARDRPHVLVWPETGMDGAAFRLACQRLAPLQCVSWGHPITSGLPTIDVFLSSDAMEPPGAEAQYSERLVRLPGLGFDWEPILHSPDPGPQDRASFGIADDAKLFFCGQALPKYLPASDDLLAGIAAEVPDAVFVLLEPHRGARLMARMRRRLEAAFARRGLDPERHLVFLGRLSRARFVALCALSDVVLDGTDWSGCNSTLEGLPTGTPVVTMEGATMRARHTAAILRAANVPEGITEDAESYIARAISFAQAPAHLRDRTRAGAATLSGGHQSAAALADALKQMAGPGPPGSWWGSGQSPDRPKP